MLVSTTQIFPKPIDQTGAWHTLTNWIDEHPGKSIVAQVALAQFDLLAQFFCRHIALNPLIKTAIQLSTRMMYTTAVGLAAITLWRWKHLFGQIIYGLLNIPYQTRICSIYEPRQIKNAQGNILAELKYHKNLPILSFHPSVTDPMQRGYLEGLILGDSILDICRLALVPMLTYLKWEKGKQGREQLQKCMQQLSLSEEVRQELKGLSAGIKERNICQKRKSDLDAEWYLKLAHILGDTFKAVGTNFACSSIACKNDNGELQVGRNFDWPSMGFMGKRLLIRQYFMPPKANGEQRKISALTFPGYVGAITAWNSEGLVIIVNELGRVSHGMGTPYSSIAKRLVEECSTLDQAKQLIHKIQQETPCASSVSIMMADKENAAIAQFYPENTTDYIIRDLKANQALIVTNHFETETGRVNAQSICEPKSVHRSDLMKQACRATPAPLSGNIEAALKAAGVPATIGVFISNQATKTKKVAFENFSAHQLIDQAESCIL